jgi:hypothetical protein
MSEPAALNHGAGSYGAFQAVFEKLRNAKPAGSRFRTQSSLIPEEFGPQQPPDVDAGRDPRRDEAT